ncbi:phage tail domain-containing protein [Weissella paramesenteroides]|uniref:Putative phage tail component domain protein n=1 Tax=Weissella paramesenteroides ATCC 33313 TaxID=585506 RepID=C5R868_WEIPA|nr:phage tail domain-containing protein [Weissella paramesenteroides]EER75652.1 putative phage tail component domain protein [Weissella paramesenteroides ATCC 33313]
MKFYKPATQTLLDAQTKFKALPSDDRHFFYGGKYSSDFGVYLQHSFTFVSPETDITYVEVPGRDGSVAISNNRYKTVVRTLPIAIVTAGNRSIETAIQEVDEWFKGTYAGGAFMWSAEPDVYYNVYISAEYTFTRINQYAATADVQFRFEPKRFLLSGLTETTIKSGGTINNPTKSDAYPTIKLTGSGDTTITIGSQTMKLLNLDGGIILDSKAMTAISTKTNDNSMFRINSLPFLKLLPGNNTISWTTTGDTTMTIIPKWEELI